jgi:hypothetical protein
VIRRLGPADAADVARLAREARAAAIPNLPDLHTPAQDIAFYRRHGFTVVDQTDGSGNEEGLPDYLLERTSIAR